MENNYYKVDALSFSSLSRLAKHPSAFKTKANLADILTKVQQ